MIFLNNNRLYLTSPIPPSVNHYLKYRAFKKGDKAFSTVFETKEAKMFKRRFICEINNAVHDQGFIPDKDKMKHYYCDCLFYFDRVDKDPNNYFKLLLDAITESGSVWPDDNIVCERVNGIFYDRENPRIEMCIYPVQYVGIFKDSISFESFKGNCSDCRFYRSGACSILNESKKGHVRPEITDETKCSKYAKRK